MARPTQLCVIGRTGDGKSALCHLLAKHLGAAHTPFQAADSTNSHTHAPVSYLVSDVNITDTPGLMDSMGAVQDAENIRGIVSYLRSLKVVHLFLLVVNEQAPRFDSGMISAVKLIADSFRIEDSKDQPRREIFPNMGIVFTRSFGFRSPEKAQDKTREICSTLTFAFEKGNPPYLECWQVDCHPGDLAMLGVPEERIALMKSATSTAVERILSWARSRDPMPMDQAVAAQYDHVRLLEEEKKARERDNTVVSTFTESRTRMLGTTSTPIWGTENHRQRVAFMSIGKLGTRRVSRTVQIGTHVVRHMVEEQREGQALGSGRVIYGEWQEIRRWDE